MLYFKHYNTTTLIARIEAGVNDSFVYTEIMDELHIRAKDGELTAFQFLVSQGLNNPDIEESYG